MYIGTFLPVSFVSGLHVASQKLFLCKCQSSFSIAALLFGMYSVGNSQRPVFTAQSLSLRSSSAVQNF